MNTSKVYFVLFALIAFLGLGFTTKPSINHAKVSTNQELYIFYLSEPVLEYEVLGEVKSGPVLLGLPSELLESTSKRAKKNYADADGIIFLNEDMTRAKVIKFRSS